MRMAESLSWTKCCSILIWPLHELLLAKADAIIIRNIKTCELSIVKSAAFSHCLINIPWNNCEQNVDILAKSQASYKVLLLFCLYFIYIFSFSFTETNSILDLNKCITVRFTWELYNVFAFLPKKSLEFLLSLPKLFLALYLVCLIAIIFCSSPEQTKINKKIVFCR